MIRIDNLRKDFRTLGSSAFVLENVSFQIREHEMVAVLGSNGSGKSTLLKLISGVLEADAGSISCENDGETAAIQSGVNSPLHPLYLDQDAGKDLVPSMTIAENLCLAQISGHVASLRFPSRKPMRTAAENALRRIGLGLETRMHEQVRFLSGGEKQGLVLARALLFHSRLLLLDEFVSALAKDLALKTMAVVRQIVTERNAYCMFVTHEIELAFRFADTVLFIHNGHVIGTFMDTSAESRQKVVELYAACLRETTK